MANRGHTPSPLRALALLLALPLLGQPGPRAVAQEATLSAPDFSHVTTTAAARKLVREGKLVEILYFPAEFGGPHEPHNIGYVTPQAAEMRERVIGQLDILIEGGAIDKLNVVPDYEGDSVIPRSITMTASHSSSERTIATTIAVW